MLSPLNSFKVLSALDNEHSLWPLLVKDMADNVGRSAMEYHRGGKGAHHAGRERLIEEFATTAVWIGGRKALNLAVIDPIMSKMGLDPAVDILLFLKNKAQHIPGWIKQKQSQYIAANVIRFLVGTLVPVAVIGWVIPTINQAITKQKLAEEHAQQKQLRLVANPYVQRSQHVRFNGASPVMQKLAQWINNDFWGNVAIDAGISGGRLYKARNWVDRTETAIRESSIVLFMYFLGDYVKGHLKRMFNQQHGVVTDLTFNSLGWLKKQKVNRDAWKAGQTFLSQLNPKTAFGEIAKCLNVKTGRFDAHPVLELARHQGLISVLKPGDTRFIKNAAPQLDPRKWLDVAHLKSELLGQKGLVNQIFKGLSAQKLGGQLQNRVNQTIQYKGIALFASYAISTLSIAVLTPLFQHWVTQQLTGSKDFPGIKKF